MLTMKGKRGWKILLRYNLLSLFLVIGLIVLTAVLAGDVIIKEGDVEISDDLNSSGVLYVDSVNDRVGIGTYSPGAKLEVMGTLNISNSSGTGIGLFQDSVGNVGIGTASPNIGQYSGRTLTLFDITETTVFEGIRSITSSQSEMFAMRGGSDANSVLGGFAVYSGSTGTKGQVRLQTSDGSSNLDRMIIDENGQVGIGTMNPVTKLHIESGVLTINRESIPTGINTFLNLTSNTSFSGGAMSIDWFNRNENEIIARISVEPGSGYDNPLMRFLTSNGLGSLSTAMVIDKSQNVGIGTISPTYPLTVVGNVSTISIWSDGNISASGFITRTTKYDKSRGKALDFIQDSDYYNDSQGKINHSRFYGYVNFGEVPDLKKPVESSIIEQECRTDENNITTCDDITSNIITYPFNRSEEGVSLNYEIDVLRQALYELKKENELMKTELCRVNSLYEFC